MVSHPVPRLSPVPLTPGEEHIPQFSIPRGGQRGGGTVPRGSVERDGRRARGASSTLAQHQSEAWQPWRAICRKTGRPRPKIGILAGCTSRAQLSPRSQTHRPGTWLYPSLAVPDWVTPGRFWGALCTPTGSQAPRRMPRCGAVPKRCRNTWAPGFYSGELFIPPSIAAALRGERYGAAPPPMEKIKQIQKNAALPASIHPSCTTILCDLGF